MSEILKGKIAIVTGAGGGQGRAEALLFSSEGASVVATDIKSPDAETEKDYADRGIVFLSHNVADEDAWSEVVARAVAEFGGVDILINNAGITGYGTVLDTSREELQRFMDIHVFGPMFGIQAVAPEMKKRGVVKSSMSLLLPP